MSDTTPNIKAAKKLFAVEVNTDLTEGRGYQYSLCFCEKETTAIRMSKGRDVQGCDGRVSHVQTYMIDGVWYAPRPLVYSPTAADEQEEKNLADRRAKQILLDKFKSGEEITPEEREKIMKMITI